MKASVQKPLFILSLVLAMLVLGAGCSKEKSESAEDQALKRHAEEQQARRQSKKLWADYMKQPGPAATLGALAFLKAHKEHLPGIPKADRGTFCGKKKPELTPNGIYYSRVEVEYQTEENPPQFYHFVVFQVTNKAPFRLQRVWRADAAGTVLEEYSPDLN